MAFNGVVDGFQSDLVFGWACDMDRPEQPCEIDFHVNGAVRATIRCGVTRKDLADHGIGTGQHGFRFDPVPFLVPGMNRCKLLFAGTKRMLRNGERQIIMPRASGHESWAPTLDPATAWNSGELPAPFAHRAGQPALHRAHVLGLFNSGTNYVQQFLIANETTWLRQGDYDIQPKHLPVQAIARLSARVSDQARGRILYGISTRNPFQWIAAMKSSRYGCTFDSVSAPFAAASFLRDNPWNEEMRIAAGFSEQQWRALFTAGNIVDYWNRYHADWLSEGKAAFGSVMMVRYEDAVAHPCEVLRLVRHAIGLDEVERIIVNVGNAKRDHRKSGDFWSAKRKVMMPRTQLGLTPDEIAFIGQQLSREICEHLRYPSQLDFPGRAAAKRAATRSSPSSPTPSGAGSSTATPSPA